MVRLLAFERFVPVIVIVPPAGIVVGLIDVIVGEFVIDTLMLLDDLVQLLPE